MKLVVLGATGGIGQELVGQAIDRGHAVTAFVRKPDALQRFAGRIAILRGDLLNPIEMRRALEGHEAILSGFGPRLPLSRSDDGLLRRFGVTLADAMRQSGVRRGVFVSTAFLFKDSLFPPAYLFGRLFFPSIVRDAAQMETIFETSGLDWTIVRPPRLTGQPHRGKYRVRDGHLPPFGFVIPRAGVADFMIGAVENRTYIGRIVGLSS
jgi:putative NADH-flavin reductase